MIIVEKFDIRKYTLEKKSFIIDDDVFHVGKGYSDEDCLGQSSVYSSESVAEIRQDIWAEIQKYLPRYKANKNKTGWYSRSKYLPELIYVAETYKELKKIKLIYVSELDKAELFKRVIEWLVTQI